MRSAPRVICAIMVLGLTKLAFTSRLVFWLEGLLCTSPTIMNYVINTTRFNSYFLLCCLLLSWKRKRQDWFRSLCNTTQPQLPLWHFNGMLSVGRFKISFSLLLRCLRPIKFGLLPIWMQWDCLMVGGHFIVIGTNNPSIKLHSIFMWKVVFCVISGSHPFQISAMILLTLQYSL